MDRHISHTCPGVRARLLHATVHLRWVQLNSLICLHARVSNMPRAGATMTAIEDRVYMYGGQVSMTCP